MNPDVLVSAIAPAVLATVCGMVALMALTAAVCWREARVPALLLAWAMLHQTIDQVTSTQTMRAAFGIDTRAAAWPRMALTYVGPIPWALMVEHMVGAGWRGSIRRVRQAFIVTAVAAIAWDVASGSPGSAAGVTRVVTALGAVAGLLNLTPSAIRSAPHLRVLRAGLIAFLTLVVHDIVAGMELLPWHVRTGSAAVLVFVGCLAYSVVAQTLRGMRDLRAVELEMETARRIQASILPAAAPPLERASLVFRYVPAAAVAGDLFEFLDAGPGRVGVLVADVSGHGVPAALIASMVKVAAAAQRSHAHDPARVLAGIHETLARELPPAHFVTAVYVYVDLEHAVIRHASAGHPPALVCRASDRTVERAGTTGPLIIAFAPAVYPVSELTLEPGDRLVLYTDGIIEATAADGDMFGEARLAKLVAESAGGADVLASSVMRAVTRFARPGSLEDDCTLVVLEMQTEQQGVSGAARAVHAVATT